MCVCVCVCVCVRARARVCVLCACVRACVNIKYTKYLFIVIFSVLCTKFGSPYLDKAEQPPRAALYTHSYQCVCTTFVCPDSGMAAGVWDF